MTTSTLIGVPALADALGVDQSTIHRRIKRGELKPAGYAGKQPLFLPSDVDAMKRGERHLTEEAAK